MALSYGVSASAYGTTPPTLTYSITPAATPGTWLIVNIVERGNSTATHGTVMYGGNTVPFIATTNDGVNTDTPVSLFALYLGTPDGAAHNIVVTFGTGALRCSSTAETITGAFNIAGNSGSNHGTSTTPNISLSTSYGGSLIASGIWANIGTSLSSTGNTTVRVTDTNEGQTGSGTTTTTAAGSNSVSYSIGSSSTWAINALEIRADVPNESISVSESVTIIERTLNISVFDSITVSESTTDTEANLAEISCSLVVSAYKGLTSTLETAQQSYVLRPFFNAKIIDDTLQPNQVISSNLPPLNNGSADTAPDGTVCAVGLDASGNVRFYKSSNLHSGTWDSSVLIAASGGLFASSLNNYSIAVSDYINGTYAILIAYHDNITNTASNVTAQGWLSTNGGASFVNVGAFSIGSAGSNYFGDGALNLSISAMKPRLVNNVLKFGWFFIVPNSNDFLNAVQQGYDIKYAYGDLGSITGPITWGHRYVDSEDWTIQGLTTYYTNGIDYVVFSGFRNFIDTPNLQVQGSNAVYIPQYGLWLTGIEQQQLNNNNGDSSSTGDVWLLPQPIFNSIAVGNTNLNSFTFPVASVINGVVNISFFAQIVDAIISQTLGDVTKRYSYMLIQSIDGVNFTYPAPFVMNDGSEFSGNMVQSVGVSITEQGNYRYLLGSGLVWEYVQNNIVADITNDVVQYTISESAGQPSSITLQLANQNNQWYPNGTNPGSSAIAGDRKVVFQQGYYANGVPETVPRNIYFIDDINQNTNNTSNDVTISARDIYKKFKTTVTRWAFNWYGPFFYADSFDGTTLGNWNQESGGWYETANSLTLSASSVSDSNILLSSVPRVTEASVMGVAVKGLTGGNIFVYAYYFDSNNWLRLNYGYQTTFTGDAIASTDVITLNSGTTAGYNITSAAPVTYTGSTVGGLTHNTIYYAGNITTNSFKLYTDPGLTSLVNITADVLFAPFYTGGSSGIEKCVAGSKTLLYSFTTSLIPNGETHMVWVRQYDYYKFSFFISSITTGNTIDAWTAGTLVGSGEFDLTSDVIAMPSQVWSVGVGANNAIPTFSNFQYSQFNTSNNISDIIQSLGTKAGIFSYNIQNTFQDVFFDPSDWYPNGDSTTFNRVLTVVGQSNLYKNDETFDDGEIAFTAKCIGSTQQFYFYFRVDSPTTPTAAYRLNVRTSGGTTNVEFERLYSGTWYAFPSCQSFLAATALGGLNFDLTKIHTYRIIFSAGWMYAYIDQIMVAAWNDNNSTSDYLSSGYIGFGTPTGATLMVFGVTATAFWKQSPSFSLNPGDDIEGAITGAVQSIRGWIFSDLFGYLKAVLLNSNDASTYTYENQIFVSGVDTSDKEYVSQVTVYGSGVSATARDTTLMAGVPTRDLVIVDYTILTQQDAQNRADYELTNKNQYRVQLNPKQAMNVGAELFDPVTVVDTGNNSSGVNTTTRVYAQKLTTGGQNNEYSIELDTGTL